MLLRCHEHSIFSRENELRFFFLSGRGSKCFQSKNFSPSFERVYKGNFKIYLMKFTVKTQTLFMQEVLIYSYSEIKTGGAVKQFKRTKINIIMTFIGYNSSRRSKNVAQWNKYRKTIFYAARHNITKKNRFSY